MHVCRSTAFLSLLLLLLHTTTAHPVSPQDLVVNDITQSILEEIASDPAAAREVDEMIPDEAVANDLPGADVPGIDGLPEAE